MLALRSPELEIFASGIAGLLSHRFLFASREWHLRATSLLKFYLLSYATITLYEVYMRHLGWRLGFVLSSIICGVYALCLWGSMIVYRIFFHPLRDFPGPVLARVSKLWHVAHCYDSKNHLLMEKLFAKYGSFVRTGRVNICHERIRSI